MNDELRELDTLLEYLVRHNEEHADELMDLTARAAALGESKVNDHLLKGVELLKESNQSLREALTALRG